MDMGRLLSRTESWQVGFGEVSSGGRGSTSGFQEPRVCSIEEAGRGWKKKAACGRSTGWETSSDREAVLVARSGRSHRGDEGEMEESWWALGAAGNCCLLKESKEFSPQKESSDSSQVFLLAVCFPLLESAFWFGLLLSDKSLFVCSGVSVVYACKTVRARGAVLDNFS